MALQITTLFLYTFLASSPLGNIPLDIDGTSVRVMTNDPATEKIYLEFSDTKFSRELLDHSVTPVGFDVTILESLLRLVFNRCFDLDNPAVQAITLNRNAAPHTYVGEATSLVYEPDYVDITPGSTPQDKYIVEVDLLNQEQLFARSTGIDAFTIDLPTVACA